MLQGAKRKKVFEESRGTFYKKFLLGEGRSPDKKNQKPEDQKQKSRGTKPEDQNQKTRGPKAEEQKMKQYLEAGKITRTHGIRGELVMEVWADSPSVISSLGELYYDPDGTRPIGLISSREHKGRLLLTLRSVSTVEQADRLRGRILYLNRDDIALPEGRYFLEDLIGLRAIDGETGQSYGTIAEVIPAPANDVYRITDGGREYLFPAVEHMIKRTDIESGVIELLPIPGIFDGGGEEA